jgi:phage baseplate assembly protein V
MNADLEARVRKLESVLRNLCRAGEVVAVDEQAGTARVQFADAQGLVSHPCRVLVDKSLRDKSQWMPDLGEQVLCLFLAGGLEQGFIIRAIYSKADPAPGKAPHVRFVRFEDGTELEYDREAHLLRADVKGAAEVKAEEGVTATTPKLLTLEGGQGVVIRTPSLTMQGLSGGGCAAVLEADLTLRGDLSQQGSTSVSGDVTASGSIMDGGGNSNHHSH